MASSLTRVVNKYQEDDPSFRSFREKPNDNGGLFCAIIHIIVSNKTSWLLG